MIRESCGTGSLFQSRIIIAGVPHTIHACCFSSGVIQPFPTLQGDQHADSVQSDHGGIWNRQDQ